MTQIMSCDYELGAEQDPLDLDDKTEEEIEQWYWEALDIVDKAKQMEVTTPEPQAVVCSKNPNLPQGMPGAGAGGVCCRRRLLGATKKVQVLLIDPACFHAPVPFAAWWCQ